eukprot:TRINITY_DN8333_c0_g1_i7.p1 TRINITY_DN8333_c0_g1~~TRINITY_DN8333_c0_g1_i7.p1  ORF type:complete len:121 (+),score=21.27 TRINITY_DN8333_c0_g1_i7:273-635(+)
MLSPSIFCSSEVYHPNIDQKGKIHLHLFDDWKPVYTLVAFSLMCLFLDPNPLEGVLNEEAARELLERPKDFEKRVFISIQNNTFHSQDDRLAKEYDVEGGFNFGLIFRMFLKPQVPPVWQ